MLTASAVTGKLALMAPAGMTTTLGNVIGSFKALRNTLASEDTGACRLAVQVVACFDSTAAAAQERPAN